MSCISFLFLPVPFFVLFSRRAIKQSLGLARGETCLFPVAALFFLHNPFLRTSSLKAPCQESTPLVIHLSGSSSCRSLRCSLTMFVEVTLSKPSIFKATLRVGPAFPHPAHSGCLAEAFVCQNSRYLVQRELKACQG